MPKLILWGLVVIGVVFLGFALNTARQYVRWSPFGESPEARAGRLAAHWRIVRPEGQGPFPAAIVLSGCDGVRDNMDYWADVLVQTGRAVLILDSHKPRGLDQLESWRLVCAGQALSGAERSGDIAVALKALYEMEDISGDVVLLGASHGGWTAIEFVAHAVSGEVPTGLSRWPEAPETLLKQVSALVLLYPYCGVLNSASPERWQGAPPSLFVLSENDSIVSTPDCIALAKSLRSDDEPVEIAVIPGADHGFDQQEKSVLSTLAFNSEQRDEARGIVLDFLQTDNPR